ncbi:hypothetical protein HanRHA438_Chr02g0088681 [Helianthus annuus]|nr:hypothetical protein HanRHA438_Chr02g0088681 [Helianthus annuus]
MHFSWLFLHGQGGFVLILCSYVTLPLYALVTQMGSTMKPAVFNKG